MAGRVPPISNVGGSRHTTATSPRTTMAAARAGLGCGAALGFDNAAYAEQLGLAGSDEAPLLILMIGHERALPGDYVYRIA